MSAPLNFALLRPASLDEAIAQMQTHPNARFLAGGSDLLPNLRRGIGVPDTLVALDGIKALSEISETKTHVEIGAGVTLADLLASTLPTRFPALNAAAEIASPSLRQAATIGGNLCLDTRCRFYNQSKFWRKANNYCLKLDGDTCHVAPKGKRCHATFSGDLAPALLVLGAKIQVVNSKGARWQPLSDLYREDGLDHLTLAHGDLLAAVRFPVRKTRSGYLKSRIRRAGDFPLAGVAVSLGRKGDTLTDLRVAVTGTNSAPLLFDGFEPQSMSDETLSQINKRIGQAIKPMRTTNQAGLYRRQMVAALTKRLITNLYKMRVD
jgi:4-hydroxybenzoyl-CoA reductase subunit beta